MKNNFLFIESYISDFILFLLFKNNFNYSEVFLFQDNKLIFNFYQIKNI